MSKTIPFIFNSLAYNTSKVFFAHLRPEIHKPEQLLEALYHLLWFPGYFGFNWNALNDCLTDFEWITANRIVLVHNKLPQIPETDLIIYLEILRDSVLTWERRKNENQYELVFDVIFPANCCEKITKLLSSAEDKLL